MTQRELEDESYVAIWHGFIFAQDVSPGRDTVAALLAEVALVGVARAVASLKGVFLLNLRHKPSGMNSWFVDNAGLFKAYRSDTRVSPSFLDLVTVERRGWSDISQDELIEFLQFGNIHFGNTFFPSIKKLQFDEIVSADEAGRLTVSKKPLPPLRAAPGKDIRALFSGFSRSFRGETVSIDLTGGFDSRLIACLFAADGLSFEAAISGTAGHVDLQLGGEVAKTLGVPFHGYLHEPHLTPDLLDRLFHTVDGISDMIRYHRVMLYQMDRLSRGVTLSISGMGGELYRDFWWLQDFPFYGHRTANLGRLYRWRICPQSIPAAILAPELRASLADLAERMIGRLKSFVDATNTLTYDKIYYFMKMQEWAGCYASNSLRVGLPLYPPLLDYDCVRIGLSLPLRLRAFNAFHRRWIGELRPDVAAIMTTEGFTAQKTGAGLPAGLVGYVRNKLQRLSKKTSQKAGGPSVYTPVSPDHPLLLRQLLALPQSARDTNDLRLLGLLDATASLDTVPQAYVGRFLTLVRLARHLGAI